jgi:hypothetical protein
MTLIESDGNGFRPSCFGPLANYQGPLLHEQYDLPHPLGTFNHSWSEVLNALEKTLGALDAVGRSNSRPEKNEAIEILLSSQRELLYRATEFIENIEGNVARSLSTDPKRAANISGPTSLRKIVAVPCNKLKHNHNRIGYVEANASVFNVVGYAIYHIRGGTMQPNAEINKDRRAVSFNVELRRIIASLYLYAEEAGRKILRLNSGLVPVKFCSSDERTIAVIKKVLGLPIFAMPSETRKHMPSISFDGQKLAISLENGLIFPAPMSCRMLATFAGDGATRNFAPP